MAWPSAEDSTSAALARRVKKMRVGDRVVRRNPVYYGRAVRLFDRLESSSLGERRSFTEERLRDVLRVATRFTAYGRRTGAGGTLAEWPLLAKEAIRDDRGAFLVPWALVGAGASTSGTTGTPLAVMRSPRSLAVEQAAIDRLARMRGVDLATAKAVVLRGDDITAPVPGRVHWRDDSAGRRRVFQSNDLSEATIDTLAQAIDDFRPDCLLAYPTVLESLCLLLGKAAGRSISIPLTMTSSENLSQATRETAEQVLGTSVIDYYGQAERVSFAYSLLGGDYRFLAGYGLTELVPVAEDEEYQTFEIVGTPLWNLSMPLVRYRTGDVVSLPKPVSSELLERIAYGLAPIPAIGGRVGDYLVAPDGTRLVGIDHIPRGVDNIFRLQVIQERRDLVRILVLAKGAFGDPDRSLLASHVERKLPATITYTLEEVDVLELQGGKAPAVIRRPGV